MHEVLVNRLGGLSLPKKSVVRLTDCPDMTLDVSVDVKQQCNVKVKFSYIGFCMGKSENYVLFDNYCSHRPQSWFKYLNE